MVRAQQVIAAQQAGRPLAPAPRVVCATRSHLYARWLLDLQALDLTEFQVGPFLSQACVLQLNCLCESHTAVLHHCSHPSLTQQEPQQEEAAGEGEQRDGMEVEGGAVVLQADKQRRREKQAREAAYFLLRVAQQLQDLHVRDEEQ